MYMILLQPYFTQLLNNLQVCIIGLLIFVGIHVSSDELGGKRTVELYICHHSSQTVPPYGKSQYHIIQCYYSYSNMHLSYMNREALSI